MTHHQQQALAPVHSSWLSGAAGQEALRGRIQEAVRALLEAGLEDRLNREMESSRAGGSKVFRIGNSLKVLNEEITILTLGHRWGEAAPEEVWARARKVWAMTLTLDSLTFQGRMSTPPWRSDLWTADIGASMAFNVAHDSPLGADTDAVKAFLQTHCWEPIAADWIEDATRIHSLDSMGHNWWSVIVGGAGVVAALLGWSDRAEEVGHRLNEWFRYPGNAAFHKQPNFGAEGDFVEGFAYGDYALLRPCTLAYVEPGYRFVPGGLSPAQCQGLVDWYKHAFIKTTTGYWPRRLGDIGVSYRPIAAVWHTLARLTGDEEFLHLAHELRPHPHTAFDFLMWEPLAVSRRVTPSRPIPRIFPVSGFAFLGGDDCSVAVRAGEFWNHNHQDAGSFIFHQDGVVWVDDMGTCKYSSDDYAEYYTAPVAHNVAYAPDLAPSNREGQYRGQETPGRFVAHGLEGGVELLHVDTRSLSDGRLARSQRRFLLLDQKAVVIWDDLEDREEQAFEFLLHTSHAVNPSSNSISSAEGKACSYAFFSDVPCVPTSSVGTPTKEPEDENAHMHHLRWRTETKSRRGKFGLVMGVGLGAVKWTTLDSGWQCVVEVGGVTWSLWFNRQADGRVAHMNTTGTWNGLETDGYALLLRAQGAERTLTGVEASFIRGEGGVIQGGLSRRTLSSFRLC